jgi:hypothetical protein
MSINVEVDSNGDDVVYEPQIINQSGLSDTQLRDAAEVRQIASQLSKWIDNTRAATQRTSMFDRGTFTPPENFYDELRAARKAVQFDDIVAGVAETTEGFAFQGVKWESEEPDEADVFNQWAGMVNLDAVIRRMWREEYTGSMFYAALEWGWHEFTVRGRSVELPNLEKKTDPLTGQEIFEDPRDPDTNRPMKPKKGPKRKKKFKIWCPLSVRILDSAKIVPVGTGPLAGQAYAWQASPGEIRAYAEAMTGEKVDVTMTDFFLGLYRPDAAEKKELEALGVDVERLLLMNPDYVFGHTLTKPDYERFPQVRLKSIFPLLDLKRQLMQADRAMLIGAANYILLVRKGTKDDPATQEEVDHLRANYNFIAKLPVIISDHRLEIEIIAPKTDFTLQQDKYDVIDTRILARLLGTLSLGSRGQRNETNVTLSFAVARAMENRRHMVKRTLELHIAKAIVEHENNKGKFEEEPNLVYTPRNISLGFDASQVQAIMNLRTQKEISRETILEYFGLDQATEAMRRELEEQLYDPIFQTQVPFSAAGGQPPAAQGAAGAQGGRPAGGGQPASNATKTTPKTPAGNSKKAGS